MTIAVPQWIALAVYQNIDHAVKQLSKNKAEISDWLEHNPELVYMSHALDKRPAEISDGMKQRVGITRALTDQLCRLQAGFNSCSFCCATCTLSKPRSASRYNSCLGKLLKLTWSKSTRVKCPRPELTR